MGGVRDPLAAGAPPRPVAAGVEGADAAAAAGPLGVVGAGTMGAGIAEVAARAGFPTLLYDAFPEALDRALARIRASLERAVARGRLAPAERDAALARLQPVDRLEALAGCAAVVEAVPEDLELKRGLFRRLDALCPPPALLCTNTSSLSVTALAAATGAPERVVGLHFFNPAPVMPLVEVVAGAATAREAVARAEALARALGKVPVRVQDSPGFLVNRVARPYYGEALRLLGEGVAGVAEVDAALRGAGFPMGPFELMDLIGLDVNLAVTRSVYEATFHEPRYRPHRLQQQRVDAGWLGRKAGRGFYAYDAEGRAVAPAPPPREVPAVPPPRRVLLVGEGSLPRALAERWRARGVEVAATPDPGVELAVDAGAPDGRLRELDRHLPRGCPWALSLLARPLAAARRALGGGRPACGYALLPPLGDGSWLEWTAPAGDAAAEAAAASLAASLGLPGLRVADSPGGVAPRVVACLVNEAAFAVDEGLATPEDVDRAMRLGMNHPRGPFAWLELWGAADVLRVLEGLGAWFGEDRYRPAPGLRRLALAAGG